MSEVDALAPRLLRAFVAVGEELHFGRAAARLHMTQPPLSVQIQKLEGELGLRLFVRDRRHVALTEAGQFLLGRARRLLDDGARTCAEAHRIARGEAGSLSVGYTPTAVFEALPPLLRRYRRRAPEVRLELIEMASAKQADAIQAGRIEIGFACGPIDAQGLVEHVVVRERFVALVPRRHALASRRRLRVTDLHGQPTVLVRPDVEPAWAGACSRALVRAGVELQIVQETDSKMAMLGLVAAGIGLSIGSSSMTRVAHRGIVFREIVDLAVRVPLVTLSGPSPSPRARQLLAEIQGPDAPPRGAGRVGAPT
jgi:DNA-binding transcriptional LysR family regulator